MQSLDDVLVFCLVEQFGSDGDSICVEMGKLGRYANELLPKSKRETKSLRQILALHADKFCVSGDRVTIRQRPTWPEPSIDDAVPTSLSKLSDGVEREEGTDSSTVTADTLAGRLRKTVPDITEALLKQPVFFKGSLGKTSAESDATKLASAFEKCIEQYGVLMHILPCRPMTTMMSRFPWRCFACSPCCLAVQFHTQQRRGRQSAERGLLQERKMAQERKRASRRLTGLSINLYCGLSGLRLPQLRYPNLRFWFEIAGELQKTRASATVMVC